MMERRVGSSNSYISVRWIHANPDEPVVLVSELSAARMEMRRIEYWKDGRVGIASRESSTQGTILRQAPVPELAEINADRQFVGEAISEAEFNAQWQVYT